MKWQTGPYDRFARYQFTLPYPFLLLCKLTAVTPEIILRDFMENLTGEVSAEQEKELNQFYLMQYFLGRGYGQHQYTALEIKAMFTELQAINRLWPDEANIKFIERHAKWRAHYEKYWFKKWQRKSRKSR